MIEVSAYPQRPVLFRILVSLSLILAAAACTTTTRVEQSRPVSLNSNPSGASELHLAEVALQSGDVGMATTIYERMARANPQSAPALTGLGNTLYVEGDFTRAGVYFSQAAQLDASANAPLIGMARVAIRQRRFDEAIALYGKILAMSPDNVLALSGIGVALDMKGEHAKAQDALRQALLVHPGDPLISVNLGLSLVMGGDPRQGANVLLDVARYPSAPPQARQDLALAYGLLGDVDAATRILSIDLSKDQVADNLQFYATQRAAMFPRAVSGVTPIVGKVAKAEGSVRISSIPPLPPLPTSVAMKPSRID